MKELRKKVPRTSFAHWEPAPDREDPLELLHRTEAGRIAELLTLRHQRMRADVFAFYRGGAALMAADLAGHPVTGLRVQLGGDAHLMNYGGYATPERNLIFDVNDFDETLPGPWEWDVARLCASAPLLAQVRDFGKRAGEDAAYEAARAYRRYMRALARRSPLDIWYAHVDVRGMLARELTPPRDATHVKPAPQHEDVARGTLAAYRKTLSPYVRSVLERYHPVDFFEHPVGVGSVGLLTIIAKFEARENETLYLQIKEAQASVLEPYLGASAYGNHGERVIMGQHYMQAASDLFVGWTRENGHDFYVRQLRDGKASLDLERISAEQMVDYARRCGAVLARAHARTGDPQAIAAYLGSGDAFEAGMTRFARVYAEQVARDYARFCDRVGDTANQAEEAGSPPGPVAQR
ncbi:MAG TPA: DUF2252 domain-containing protein [Candidatus Acidoferrales bacterium]|nr:DUF2252 domain-containing protein [Candidatus Acidoferrales bacterium]